MPRKTKEVRLLEERVATLELQLTAANTSYRRLLEVNVELRRDIDGATNALNAARAAGESTRVRMAAGAATLSTKLQIANDQLAKANAAIARLVTQTLEDEEEENEESYDAMEQQAVERYAAAPTRNNGGPKMEQLIHSLFGNQGALGDMMRQLTKQRA